MIKGDLVPLFCALKYFFKILFFILEIVCYICSMITKVEVEIAELFIPQEHWYSGFIGTKFTVMPMENEPNYAVIEGPYTGFAIKPEHVEIMDVKHTI